MKLNNEYETIDTAYKKLENGQEFKNYKELCNFLNQPIGAGNQKKYQLKEFERYFEYHKVGQKIIIDNIYIEALTKYSRGLYSSLIQKTLLDLMAERLKNNKEEMLFSSMKIFEMLCMVNSNYRYGKYNNEMLKQNLDIEYNEIDEFYSLTKGRMDRMLKTAIRDLKNKYLIHHEDKIILHTINRIGIYENHNKVAADDKQTKYINDVRHNIMIGMGFDNKQKLFFSNKFNEFNNAVLTYLNDNIKNDLENNNYQCGFDEIKYLYDGHRILFTENINSEIKHLEKFLLNNRDDVRKMLNTELVNSYRLTYDKLNKKAKSELWEGDCDSWDSDSISDKSNVRSSDNFIDNGNKLIDYTIKRAESGINKNDLE